MKEQGKKTGVLQDALSTFGTNAFGAVLALISSFCIMPVLDPGESGLITQNQMVGSALFTLLSFSVNSSIIYYVSRCKLKNVVRSIKRVTVVLTVLIALVGVLVVLILRDSYFADTALLYCVCAVAYGVFSFVSNIFLAILRGENKFRTYNLINLMQRVLTTLFSLTVFIWPTAAVIVSGSIFILLLSIIMAWRSIRRNVSYAQSPPAPENDREIGSGELLRYSLKSHVSNVLTFTNTNVSSIILKANNGLTDFGVFTKAYTIVQQIWILPDAVSMVIMSRIAAMTDTKDKTKLATLSCKLVTYITLICLPLVVLLAKIFIPILFPKYVDCIQPLTILTVGSFFRPRWYLDRAVARGISSSSAISRCFRPVTAWSRITCRSVSSRLVRAAWRTWRSSALTAGEGMARLSHSSAARSSVLPRSRRRMRARFLAMVRIQAMGLP